MNRKAIRLIVANTLQTAGLDVKAISLNRPSPTNVINLPICMVYYEMDDSEVYTGSEFFARSNKHTLRLSVDVIIEAKQNVDDYLDDEADKIELALFKDPTFKDTTHGIKLGAVKPYNLEDNTQALLNCVSSTFIIPYEKTTYENAKSILFENFKIDITDKNGLLLIGAEGDI